MGSVVSAWVANDGSLFALAKFDDKQVDLQPVRDSIHGALIWMADWRRARLRRREEAQAGRVLSRYRLMPIAKPFVDHRQTIDNAFNAGYTSTLSRDESGKLSVGDRHIRELSVVQKGARPECVVWPRYDTRQRS